ncbi:hypothetical protein HY382_02355 [Candidatus Curtissbacteria bacterium]|nr:hypothetical protein [Candidatus Curtissbacteria bacterium]
MACLQLKIGSCRGCPVRVRAEEAMRVDRMSEVPVLVKTVANGDCPEGVSMQVPRRQEQSVW